MIEMDVRLSRDHQVIVFHDANLRRLYKKKDRVSGLSVAHLFGRTHGEVPLLRDVLNAFRGKGLFFI